MKKNQIINIIEKEVEWCNKNSVKGVSKEERTGFIKGLKQAQLLISSYEKKED